MLWSPLTSLPPYLVGEELEDVLQHQVWQEHPLSEDGRFVRPALPQFLPLPPLPPLPLPAALTILPLSLPTQPATAGAELQSEESYNYSV